MILVLRWPSKKCGILICPTSLVNVRSHNIAHDLAMIDLSSRPINKVSTLEVVLATFVGWWGIATAVWWIWYFTEPKFLLVSQVQHEPIFGSNFVICHVLCACT